MDEHTLNDLLECSVCLDRLDTSSKVLPCQHTFCRKCLDVIFASRNELRCPECRVKVSVRINDLPPNVLLMRILEGMKTAAATTKSSGAQQEVPGTAAVSQSNNKLEESQKFNESQQYQIKLQQQRQQQYLHFQQQQQQQRQLAQQPPVQRRFTVPHAYALYDFESTEATDLHFKKGDVVVLKRKIDVNWYVGQLACGAEGTFPINYVQVVVPLPTPQCVAQYDFKMGPNEEEGCLSFKKGMVINVLRRVDQNWAEGRIGTTIGIFPIAFVELNALGKQLLECYMPFCTPPPPASQSVGANQPATTTSHPPQQQQPPNQTAQQAGQRDLPAIPPSALDPTANDSATSSSASPHSTSSTSTSPSTSTSNSSTGCNSNATSPNQSEPSTPQHAANAATSSVRYRNGAKEKRHSLNALLAAGAAGSPALNVLQANRHSAEILSAPQCNGDDDDDGFAAMAFAHMRSRGMHPQQTATGPAAETQTSANLEQQPQAAKTPAQRRSQLLTSISVPNAPTLPWGYLALYPYKPLKSDELELKKGCVYIVTERCQDGWFKGKNWQYTSGVFPGNYVTPLRSRDQQQLMHQRQQPQQAPPPPPPLSNAVEVCLQQPPELPPRHNVSGSVWTKPLSHTVEAFFKRHCDTADAGNKTNNTITAPCTATATSAPTSTTGTGITSTTVAAVNLMKRLTNIKSRSKSPSAATAVKQQQQQQQTLTNEEVPVPFGPMSTAMNSTNGLPLHVRSGSCPSQLLQSLPVDLNAVQMCQQQQQQQHHQQALQAPTLYGSHRIKGSKERPPLANMVRQSMDGTFRCLYSCNGTTIPSSSCGPVGPQPNQHARPQCQQQQQHYHRKSQSLDATALDAPMAALTTAPVSAAPATHGGGNVTAAAIAASATTKSTQNARESRFRCVVSYPPNSEIELELHVGDIIYVHRKQKNGWYKGTHARTNKTGLFPASFVEPDL